MIAACGQCGAAVTEVGTCPYCASPLVVQNLGGVDAMFVVPFAFDADQARAKLDRWLRTRLFIFDKRVSLVELRGVYAPAYLYSAVARSTWSATIGESYEVEEKLYNIEGKAETRRHRRTEHRPLSGQHVGYVTDVLVSASATLPAGDYDLRALRRWQPELVAGWCAEAFGKSRGACLAASHREALDQVAAKLRAFMPGDSHSDLEYRTRVEWESLDPLFVPVWVSALKHEKRPVRIVINGQSGKMTGWLPIIWWRVAVAVAILVAIGLAVWRAV